METESKRSLKRKKKQEYLLETRDEFKQKRKEARKRRKLSRKEKLESGEIKPRQIIKEQESSGLKLVIDCGYGDLMTEKEIKSLCRQLGYCYGESRRIKRSIDLKFTNCCDKIHNQMQLCFPNYKSWNTFEQVEGKFVYLTADSPNKLEALDLEKTYVIGGLVDHNRYKNKCLTKAKDKNYEHCSFPIKDHMDLGKKVLTINQCAQIMMSLAQNKDWKTTLTECIPKRIIK